MNCDRDLVLAYVEEDNIQRAYFRVRPLLTIHGDVQEEALHLWPDHGCLRIVPDRNEQHTFKERMRSLNQYCVINLIGVPADANKIRTNKNYKPERGESNQFILYSDAVRSLPEHTFFEVLAGTSSDFTTLAQKAITPLFYIQENDTLFGPVKKASPEEPSPASEAVGTLYPLACPDGEQRTILCMETPAEEQPTQAPETKEESLPIGESLQILDKHKGFEETLQSLSQPLSSGANLLREQPVKEQAPRSTVPVKPEKLTGTPLIKTNLRTSTPPPKNRLQEVVSSQLRVARYEPPTEALPAGVEMQHVENPVEIACRQIRKVWQIPDSRAQLVDFLLSLDGMRARLHSVSDTAGKTPLQCVLHRRLQDLEADRLTALVQLDKAKADLENFRKETIASMSSAIRKEMDELGAQKEALLQDIESLQKQHSALSAQRDEVLARVDDLTQNALPASLAKALSDASLTTPVYGIPLRMAGVAGKETSLDEMLGRIAALYATCNVQISKNACIALLLLLAISPRIGFSASCTSTASSMLDNIVRAMGWQSGYVVQVSEEQKPVAALKPVDSTPYICLSTLASYAPLAGVKRLFLTDEAEQVKSNAYKMDAWPVYPMHIESFIPKSELSDEPVSEQSLISLLEKSCVKNEEIDAALGQVLRLISPLSSASDSEMRRFIAAAASLMEGGLPAACDWALTLWIAPRVSDLQSKEQLVKLLDEYPLTRSLL